MKHLLSQKIQVYTPSATPDVDGRRTWTFSKEVKTRVVGQRLLTLKDSHGEEKKIYNLFQIADESLEEGTILTYESKIYKVEMCQEWRGYNSTKLFGSMLYCSNYTLEDATLIIP